jgi:hypothetical protein
VTNGTGNFRPKVTEQNDEYIFELRDDVYLSAGFASEKKLRIQMWRQTTMLPPDEGNIFLQSFRDKLIQQARSGFNEPNKPDAVPHIEEDIGFVATALGFKGDDGKSMHDKLLEREGPSITEKLITLATEKATLFHTPDKEAHAACKRGGHTEVYELETKEFRMWLRSEFRRAEKERLEAVARAERERAIDASGALASDITDAPIEVARPPAIPLQAITMAVHELQATAVLECPEEEVHLRVAGSGADGKIYIDLCNAEWEAVEISKEGWKIIGSDAVPIRFVRSNIMRPLPRPIRGGSVEELRRLLTLGGDSDENKGAWSLVLAWLMQSLRPNGGQYPVLILLGGHGTAKTTTVEMLRDLVDPAVVPHEHTYNNAHELYIECVASWVIAMDNLSSLKDWLSDNICRLATGGGFKTRKLYTGRDQEVFKAKRPVIMNGISDVASKADLLDRALLVDLPVIQAADRRYLEELKADFYEHQPSILGALFDAMAAGLRNVEGVDLSGRLPRMADFARWAVATEEAFGMEEGTFMAAYAGSRGDATETALEAEPIWRVLYELAMEHDSEDRWVGNMKELLGELNAMETDAALKHSKDWPKTERKLSDIIKRLGPALLELGIHVERVSKSKREGRRYYLYYHEPPQEEED